MQMFVLMGEGGEEGGGGVVGRQNSSLQTPH